MRSPGAVGGGAVSAMKRSIAATTAAASCGDAAGVTSSIRGRGGRRLPFPGMRQSCPNCLDLVPDGGTQTRRLASSRRNRRVIPVFGAEVVLGAVSPPEAIERTREAFQRHARGEWAMPAKVYLESPPAGDFRAMPARGSGLAMLKWVTSFPHNPERGLPVVTGALLLSSSETGELVAILDCASVTSLRTGAAAAVSAQALAREDARSVGLIGCGVNGTWAARCMAAAGYGPGVCADPRSEAAERLAAELGWRAGIREEAAAQDLVVTVTPGDEPVIWAADLRPGQHLAVLGADAHGKAEVELEALERCRLFCDEWEQAAGGGELSNAVSSGRVSREEVTELGSALIGEAEGRTSRDEITLFDSTGLAIQDLAIARAVLEAWRAGRVEGQRVEL
jgi:alanine dehydrogenase